MTARPTIYDVARAAGVSKSLVSLVLRGSAGVSPQSREAVERAIRDLGYRRSRAAADLAAARTGLVGVLIDDYANPWFVELLRGATHALTPHGYRLTVVDSFSPTDEAAVDALLSMRADGIIVARDLPLALRALENLPPLVVAGTREPGLAHVDSVANDDAYGARLVAEHFLSYGHHQVAHLRAGGGAARARRESFLRTMHSAGGRVVETDYGGPATEHAGFDGALRLLRANADVTALFAANDVMAIGALGAARELGVAVPDRLAIAGYDNTALSRTRYIDLTTVDDNGYGVGREAARLLHQRITQPTNSATHTLLDPVLIPRGTTARALTP